MRLFGRREKPVATPETTRETAEQTSDPRPATITIGREPVNDAPVRWALLDRSGLPGSLAVIAPPDARHRLLARALPELAAGGPLLAIDPFERLTDAHSFAIHRLGAGRGIDLVSASASETVDIARSGSAIAWWAASGADWSGAVEAILEQTIESLRRAGETPTIERLAHLLREAAARTQEPELRGGCARISEGLFAALASSDVKALFSDPAGALPVDRDLSISIAPEIRADQLALRVGLAGLFRLAARAIAGRRDGSAVIPALNELGRRDLVERLGADLLWPLRNGRIGLVVGADSLTPWDDEPGVPSAILARADAWLVAAIDENRHGWEVVLGEWADPISMSGAFDAIRAQGGDAALIAPSLRRALIALRAFSA